MDDKSTEWRDRTRKMNCTLYHDGAMPDIHSLRAVLPSRRRTRHILAENGVQHRAKETRSRDESRDLRDKPDRPRSMLM